MTLAAQPGRNPAGGGTTSLGMAEKRFSGATPR